MEPRTRRLAAALVGCFALALPGPAAALRIAFAATDLPDAGPEDLWQLDYLVSEGDFAAGQGFSIVFPVGHADALAPVATGADPEWDVLAIQPDPLLPAGGLYDAQARVAHATLGFPFSVRFHWHGDGTPGAQAFVVYDADFVTIETGETVPVPEPDASLLLAIGAAALARRARRPGRTPRCPRRRTAGS